MEWIKEENNPGRKEQRRKRFQAKRENKKRKMKQNELGQKRRNFDSFIDEE